MSTQPILGHAAVHPAQPNTGEQGAIALLNLRTQLASATKLIEHKDREVSELRAELATGFAAFWRAQAEWSQATFGTDAERGPVGPLKHLAKEAGEAMKDPTDLMEFADCLFLVCDATRRAGFTVEQLLETAWRKLEINKARQWQKPTSDEPVEHVRD